MKFLNFNYKGQVFDLSHLAPFYCEYIHPASASSDEKIYRCIVEFSGHCFTKSPNQRKGETLASYESELHYSLATETRIFCFERHRYSLQLPQIIKELANRKCFFTSADDKFLTIEVQNEEGKTVDYEIYFSLKKSKKNNAIFICLSIVHTSVAMITNQLIIPFVVNLFHFLFCFTIR